MEPRATYPLGFDPVGDDGAPFFAARSPGSLGRFDAGDPDGWAQRGGGLNTLGLWDQGLGIADSSVWRTPVTLGPSPFGTTERPADDAWLVVHAMAREPAKSRGGFYDTKAEQLSLFSFAPAATWADDPKALVDVAEILREFGCARFYVHEDATDKAKAARCLVFRSALQSPVGRAPVEVRRMIRGLGPHALVDAQVLHVGLGTRRSLRAGLPGMVVSMGAAAPRAALVDLLRDQTALAALGLDHGGGTGELLAAALATAERLGAGDKPKEGPSDKTAANKVKVARPAAALTSGATLNVGVLLTGPRGEGEVTVAGNLTDWTAEALLRRLTFCARHSDSILGG